MSVRSKALGVCYDAFDFGGDEVAGEGGGWEAPD